MRIRTILLILLLVPYAAAEQLIVNSEDWRDVFSGLQYAGLRGINGYFVLNEQQAVQRIAGLGTDTDIILLTGRDQAVPNFRGLLISNGFTVVREIESRDAIDTNIELARELATPNLVLIDDAFGHDATAVATYANMRNASVIFADQEAVFLIEDNEPEELLVYGQIPSAIFSQLEGLDPVIVNEQDRFESNFALVERFVQLKPSKSLILTNGEFLESQIITDTIPVLFTGRQRVPDEVIELLNDEGFTIGVMIGNALAPNAQYIKDRTDLSIFIKFAQGQNEQQRALDIFPIPTPNPLIQLQSAQFDPAARQLLVTYQNPGQIPIFFSAAFQTPQGTIEDPEPVFLEAGTYKTVSYDLQEAPARLPFNILYGAYPRTLELLLQGEVEVTSVDISDESSIGITDAYYDPGRESFFAVIENTGEQDAYVLVELLDVRIGGDRVRIGSDITRIDAQATKPIEIPASLTEEDLRRNQVIEIAAYYGAREQLLVKQERATLPFRVQEGSFPWLFIVGLAVVIIIVFFIVGRRRKKR